MIMKKFCLILCLLVIYQMLCSINIEYRNSSDSERLEAISIEDFNYYSLNDMKNKLRTVNQYIDYENGKVSFNIFHESMIIYVNSFYVSARGQICNLSYPIINKNGDFFVPETFFSRSLITLFPEKFSWQKNNDTLIAEKPLDRRINTIVLDPGHGGKDPGSIGKKTREKHLTLQVASKLKEKLEKNLGIKVILTRSQDEFVSLQDRTNLANKNNADLFISLHTNGARSKNAQGIEVYFFSPATTSDERAVAAFENSVVELYEGGMDAVKAYDDLQFILADLLQSEQLEESSDLSIRLQTELINVSKQQDRGVKQADFYVLRGAFMPAVLIELGFITNEKEEEKLMNKDHQDKLVNAIVEGIGSFKLKYDYLW